MRGLLSTMAPLVFWTIYSVQKHDLSMTTFLHDRLFIFKHKVITNMLSTVCFFSSIFRNRAAVSLFWDLQAPKRLQNDHKIGRKLHFGKKHNLMGFRNIQEDDCLKEEFQDEPI